MWHLHIWSMLLLAMRVMAASAPETDILSVRSSHFGHDGRHAPRQASPSVPAITITTTIDYSSVAAPTPVSRPSVASEPAIVIPFLSPTTPPSSTFLSTSALSSASPSQYTASSTPTYSPSLTASPTPSAQISTARSPFKFIYLIPAFALFGILLGGLIGWGLYGCMTRKPRVHKDDGALLIGPRYIGVDEPERHHIQDHDIERRGEPTQMKHLPEAIRANPHFCWPSFNEKPVFDPVRGFHIPDEYLKDDDPFLVPPLATRPNMNVNARNSTWTTRASKSAHTTKSTRPTAGGPSRKVLPSPTSDTTSLALLELYESDEEEETRRKAHEVPWESLRHKSIKRGILEQVKKEGKWMDSIRGLAGSTLAGSRPEAIMEEDNVLLGGPDGDDSMEVDSYVGRRWGYIIPGSDPFADSPIRTHRISPKKRPVANSRRTDSTFPASMESQGVGFRIIPESAATTPNPSPRRSFAWLKRVDVGNAHEKLTRRPTPMPESRKQNQSPSRSRSTSPVKRTSNNGFHISQVPQRDILPRSPAQIMSPPLHSQICFTPIPASPARVVHPQSSRDYHPKPRVSVSLSPTKPLMISSASKGKKKILSPRNLHRLPKPPSSANTVAPDVRLSQTEVSRGRMLQRHDTAATNNMNMKQVASRSKGSCNVNVAEIRPGMLEDPMKKVERIVASGWSARDLGQGGMRSLSPTGFGRRP